MKAYIVSNNAILDELGELLLEGLLIFIHELAHVVSNMDTHDVLAVDLSIEFLGLAIVSRETFGAVGDINASINGSLHGAKDTSSSGGTC